jgi:hypothetical protein
MSPEQEEGVKSEFSEYQDKLRQLSAKIRDFAKTMAGPLARMEREEPADEDIKALARIPDLAPLLDEFLRVRERSRELGERDENPGCDEARGGTA